eukprot:gene11567-14169_t
MADVVQGSTGNDKLLLDKAWERTQTKTFTAWCNSHLRKVGSNIESLESDLADGTKLAQLLEVISNDPVLKVNKNPKLRFHFIENINLSLDHISKHGVKLVGISAEEIVDKNLKMTLGMIWTVILRFSIADISIEELSAKEALLLWVQRKTEGYERVKVQNFHTSFQDGLAFCALIHKHRPDLLDYDSLNKDDKAANLQLAFDIAERELDIPKMLDVSDMLDVPKPDERSVMTYVAQYYHRFSASKKAETAGKAVSKALDNYLALEQVKFDYIQRATALVDWINQNTQQFNSRDFGESIESVQNHMTALKDYKNTTKPEKGQEVLELESIFNSLQTKLRLNKREPFVPPTGLSPSEIDQSWSALEKSEQDRADALRKELKRQKLIAYLLQKYNRILKKLENWATGKSSYLSSNDLGDSLTAVQAKLKNLEAFEGEYQSLQQQSNNDLNDILRQLTELQYNGVGALTQKKDDYFGGQWQDVKNAADTYKNALLEELAKLQKIEDMLVDFAKRAAQLNVWIESADDAVSDPINADSVEVVKELQAKFDAFVQDQAQQFTELDTLANLTQELRNLGRSENSYSVISYDDLSQKWNSLLQAIEERKAALEAELQTQTNNDALCQSFAEKANQTDAFIKEQSQTLSQNNSDADEQLKSIRTVLNAVQENKSLLDELVQLAAQLDDAQVTENKHTQHTVESVKLRWEKLVSSARKNEQVIQSESLAKQHTGVTAEELAEFKQCYNHFDKDNDNKLNRLELSSCLKSLGEDLSEEQLARVMSIIDKDGNGNVSFEEFVEYMVNSRKVSDTADSTRSQFRTMADDKDFITEAQIRSSITDPKQVDYLLANMPQTENVFFSGTKLSNDIGGGNQLNSPEKYNENSKIIEQYIQENLEKKQDQVQDELLQVEISDQKYKKPELGEVVDPTKEKELLEKRWKEYPQIAIITSNKPKFLGRILENLHKVVGANPDLIYVFNDDHVDMKPFIEQYKGVHFQKVSKFQHVDGAIKSDEEKQFYINAHYLEVFHYMFVEKKFEKVVFFEDDLVLSPDILDYFTYTSRLMNYDPSVFCISAWNDNAYKWNVDQTKTMLQLRFTFKREEHFGGLGFLINQKSYEKISQVWKKESSEPWDRIVQNSMQPGDECIYPTLPRSYHSPILERDYNSIIKFENEVDGWSFYQFYSVKNGLKRLIINISTLLSNEYDRKLQEKIQKSMEIDSIYCIPILFNQSKYHDFVIYAQTTSNQDPHWETYTSRLFINGRGNGNVVRSIHKGVIETTYFGRTLYLVGTYSPFYNESHRTTTGKVLLKDLQLEYLSGMNITSDLQDWLQSNSSSSRSSAFIYRIRNDKRIHLVAATQGTSCNRACWDQSKACYESDMMLLTDSLTVEYVFEDKCDTIEVNSDLSAYFAYLPYHENTFSCTIPKSPNYLSCTFTPNFDIPHGSRLCICTNPKQ